MDNIHPCHKESSIKSASILATRRVVINEAHERDLYLVLHVLLLLYVCLCVCMCVAGQNPLLRINHCYQGS